MAEQPTQIGCYMRLEWYTDPKEKPGEITYMDRLFTGKDQLDLKLNIDYFIQKYGILRAYVLTQEQAEKNYGNESSKISKEEIQQEVEEKR